MADMSLADFLLARIAEDEAVARENHGDYPSMRDHLSGQPWRLGWVEDSEYSDIGLAIDPARVFAECKAKRRIVEYDGQTDDGHVNALRALALPYADHPDYDEEWRP